MRRLLFAALAGLVLAGAALAQDTLDPKVRYNAADQARAKAALLKQSDLGIGWQGVPTASTPSLKAPICPSLRPDYSKLTLTGHAESTYELSSLGIQVVSDVEVWQTVKQAQQHMNALMKPQLPGCIKYSFRKSPGGADLQVFPVKKTAIPKVGDVSVAYRAPVPYKVGNQTVVVTSDFVFLRKGRTEIYINVVGPSTSDKQLTALEARLAKALVARVRG